MNHTTPPKLIAPPTPAPISNMARRDSLVFVCDMSDRLDGMGGCCDEIIVLLVSDGADVTSALGAISTGSVSV